MKTLVTTAAILAMAVPAAAETHVKVTPGNNYRATITYSDLNLSSPAGAETMLWRIRRAAELVCGDPLGPTRFPITNARRHRQCMVKTMDVAVKSLDAPLVTARHTGVSPTQLASQ